MGLLDAFGSRSFWTEDVPNSAKGLLSSKPDTRNVLARVLMEYAKDTPNRVRENIATNFPDPNLLTPQGMKTPEGQQARNALADVLMGFAATTMPVRRLTKFEQAHQVAQRNAALPVEQGGLGLPPNNTAMERAKALGFSDDVYHGTRNDVAEFAMDKVKSRFPYSIGVHSTTSPSEASIYADDIANAAIDFNPASRFAKPVAEGANVMPLMVRRENTLVRKTADTPTPGQSASSMVDLDRASFINDLYKAKQDGNPYQTIEAIRNAGDGYDATNLVSLMPKNIRSRFAAFDPMRRNEADLLGNADPRLLGGIAGGGLLGSYFWPKE
jgi:hypothetical protein